MFDRLYSRLTELVDYRVLIFVPPVVAALMVALIFFNGMPLGVDFQGGTWMDASVDERLADSQTTELVAALSDIGLVEVKAKWGWDASSDKHKLTISTSTEVEAEKVEEVLRGFIGELSEYDEAVISPEGEVSTEDRDRLAERFSGTDVQLKDGKVVVRALDLDEEELTRAAKSYFGEQSTLTLTPRNFNLRSVGPTLGERFRTQGIKALIVAYIFMSIVIAFAFKEFVPSIAVMAAATCDIIIAAGGMSLFGIQMEPASLAALLMLIGYSVDSDILLTARVLKRRGFEVNDRIDEAMVTGLTMTGTTLAALLMIQVVTLWVLPIETLNNISSILLIGLVADLSTTWFMNAGILKWYLERPKSRTRRWK
ncbi:MAG: hypothetical protein ABH950_08595 [Candidatus Altiarchaeota archaeon]